MLAEVLEVDDIDEHARRGSRKVGHRARRMSLSFSRFIADRVRSRRRRRRRVTFAPSIMTTPAARETLSDTLGKHDGWLTFSATTIVEITGTKVTLKKRATVAFVRATQVRPGGAKDTNDIALGSVGAHVHLVTQRVATASVAEIAAWWRRGGPLFPP